MKWKKDNSSEDKLIQFIASNKETGLVYDPPVPANTLLPEWYKRQKSNLEAEVDLDNPSGNPSRTVKACMPVFDSISAGYFALLPADVIFKKSEYGIPQAQWSTDNYTIIDVHPKEQFGEFDVPKEFVGEQAYKFNNPWTIKTPPGYSTLFMQPAMREDLPFYVIPAIVDTDRHPVSVNFPFLLKKDFTGIIEMNTPVVQMIPFKRDSWNSEVIVLTDNSPEREWQRAKRKIMNRYKTFYREPKVWR